MIGEMMAAADYGAQRGSPFHDTFVELVKDGLARGEIHTRHDPQIVADIIVGALSGALVQLARRHHLLVADQSAQSGLGAG